MNSLRHLFNEHKGRYIIKVDHFFDIYDKHFARLRGQPIRLLEIGINKGGSMELWREYFGPDCELHALDIDPNIRDVVEDNVIVHIGSQGDPAFLHSVALEHGPFDLIIDDGSHLMHHQIATFENLYPYMSDQGIYVVEDAFTSYWSEYNGRLGGENTFMEFAKRLLDELQADWISDENLKPSEIARTTQGIHFYSGIVIFERAKTSMPCCIVKDGDIIEEYDVKQLKALAKATVEQQE